VRRALMRVKFAGLESLAQALAPAVAEAAAASRASDDAVLTWVPLGRRRRRARGFDQAEAVARAVGRLTGRPVSRMLRRTIETDPQARRTGRQRRDSMRGAFAFGAHEPPPPNVVLVDDILTSGATMAECAGVLRRAGAVEVGALTVARSLNGPLPARCYDRLMLPIGTAVPPRVTPSPGPNRGGRGRKGDRWTSC
jgi:ComF family protein